jgi:chorismate mutase
MKQQAVRGIRGAINITENTKVAITTATRELLAEILKQNELDPADIASIFFTVTQDINAEFPAVAARELGLTWVPLLCCTEINIPGSLPLVIRILIHANTTRSQQEIKHIYLGEAVRLRPDINKA